MQMQLQLQLLGEHYSPAAWRADAPTATAPAPAPWRADAYLEMIHLPQLQQLIHHRHFVSADHVRH